MKNQVRVTANKITGLVFTSTGLSEKDGKEYGYYGVESQAVDRSGPLDRIVKLNALRACSKETFDADPLAAGQMIDGKIIVTESTVKNPFREKQEPKRMVNQDGSLGGILLQNGLPIYRETSFTEDLSAKSTYVKHDSVREVEEANNAAAKQKLVK